MQSDLELMNEAQEAAAWHHSLYLVHLYMVYAIEAHLRGLDAESWSHLFDREEVTDKAHAILRNMTQKERK